MHTPGPWRVGGDDETVAGMWFHKVETADQTIHEGEDPCPIALCYGIDTHVFEHLGSSYENARLIAAAPELLAACRIALEAMPDPEFRDTTSGQRHAYKVLEVAITRATEGT